MFYAQSFLHHCLVLLFVLNPIQPVAAPIPIKDEYIIDQCWTAIKVLPIYNPYKEAFQRMLDCKKLHEYSLSQVRAKLFGICKSRYYELIRNEAKDTDNQLLMTNDRKNNTLKNRKLFVLDLDESLESTISLDVD